jgi:purine-binding chemotaxis protein CheW
MPWEDLQIGMVVHQVNEVLELNAELIETEPSYELLSDINAELIAGIARVDAGNIVLLNPKTLIREPDAILILIWDAQTQLDSMGASVNSEEEQLEQEVLSEGKELPPCQSLPSFYDLYCPNATPEKREIFRQRADSLKPQTESINTTDELISLAVIGLENKLFGLDLRLVRGFTDITNLTPIPCCPNHIVGNMNLRGEIVTLVDIRKALNLSTATVTIGGQAVVVQVDDIVAGLPVERVLELVSVNATELTPLPPPLSDFSEQYLQGIVFSEDKAMRVLDLPKLFTQGGLVVNDDA